MSFKNIQQIYIISYIKRDRPNCGLNDINLLEPLVNIRKSVDNNITKINCLPDAGTLVTIAGRKQMKEINIKKKKAFD